VTAEQTGKGRRLDSWKAIASYLGHEVRSVPRWERERGLPVYRLPGQKSGVFAYEDELKRWLFSRSEGETAARPDTADSGAWRSATPVTRRAVGVLVLAVAVATIAIGMILRTETLLSNSPPAAPLSLAVLPMQNLSGDASQEYFADGFTDELVTELAQLRALRVISRTSVMVYKGSRKPLPEIARQLHVKYVLEGSMAREGSRVRVIAQLIDAASDTHVAAHTYNFDVRDALDVQGQISRAIADDVRLDLSPGEKARLTAVHEVDPEAHDLYLRGSYQFAEQTAASIRQSLALYQAAAAKDPSFARAYVGIAQAEAALLQITAESPDVTVRHERAALVKALAVDPHLGDARGLLASLIYWRDWNWPDAEREFRLALADGAQAPTEQRFGYALTSRGLFAEGTAHLQTALELDPLGKSPRVSALQALLAQRKFAEARPKIEALLASSPDFLAGHFLLGADATMLHDCPTVAAEAAWIEKHFPSPMADIQFAFAGACRGDVSGARRSLKNAAAAKGPAFASPYQLALGYALIHDRETALSYLEKSAAMREPQVLGIKIEPVFDWIRTDSRYVALERKLGLLE